MIKALMSRIRQKHRTIRWPDREPAMPDRFRGRPEIERARCPADCRGCVESCPTGAIERTGTGPRIDLGRCLFCADCVQACEHGALRFTQDYRLAVRERGDLVRAEGEYRLARALDAKSRRLFGRSLKLRQVSAGGCNGCEADMNVLSTVVFDMGRFGIQFVASPRHADGLLITGPVTTNMLLALRKTYEALPPPKLVIAAGACAISGGPYIGRPEVHNGATELLPVDLYIPGCPPHPMTTLDGLLRLLGRLESA
jgi:Ni,Fe-hydrogenase III small subunit/Pyruvate/2-oxoacid:ferredoxin oxidoreductase delta subunit